jgi:hypothetical protein
MAVLQGVPRLTLGWADLLGDPVEERLHLRTTMLQRQLEPAMQEAVVITPLPQRPTVPTRRRLLTRHRLTLPGHALQIGR